MRTVYRIVLGVAAVTSSWLAASEIPGPSFESQLSLRDVQGPRVSPDGTQVVFEVRTTDWKNNRFDTELWIGGVRGEDPHPLTRTAEGSSGSPQWSPDGQWVAFTANRDEKTQIHVIRARGGEARPVTADEGIKNFIWSPDGTRIVFTKSEPEGKPDKEREQKYGRFAVEDHEYRQEHLWMVDVQELLHPSPERAPCFPRSDESEEPSEETTQTEAPEADAGPENCQTVPPSRRLTEGDFSVNNPRWSPDGRKIAFERRVDPGILSFLTADIDLLDVASREIQTLVSGAGVDVDPIWSPDSEWILYQSDNGDTESNFYRNAALFKVPASGGEAQRLAAGFDERMSVVDWNPSGIYFTAWQRMRRQLFLLDPERGTVSEVSDAPDQIWSVDFSKDGSLAVLSAEQPGGLDEIYWTPMSHWQPRLLTRMSDQISGWELGTREVVRWKSRDGADIEGVLYKPAGFDPTSKYPLFVVIHGGPTGIDYPTAVPGSVYPILQWLARGAVVLRPNYRGSAGYGEAFRSLNVRNLGVGDAWDVLSGVDHLIEQGFVDTEKMGAMGWSQGGYISAFLTTNTDRFQAISVGAGISNWTTYYVNTDIHPFTRQYLKATPWDDPEIYALTSPMTNIKHASTPTLIQHGEFDRRVPIPNAYELYQGLQDVGVETRLIVYKGFGHGISKPKERLAAIQHNWDWFDQYVWRSDGQQ